MSGVEVLNVETITTTTGGFNWELCLGIVFFGALIGFLAGLSISPEPFSPVVGVLIGFLGGVLIGILGGICWRTPVIEKVETQYKVIVSDEVSMNEFLEKYKILDQEGKIYTVVEKEEN